MSDCSIWFYFDGVEITGLFFRRQVKGDPCAVTVDVKDADRHSERVCGLDCIATVVLVNGVALEIPDVERLALEREHRLPTVEFRIGKTLFRQQISGMSTVAEIESALKKLPVQHALEVAQWLESYLKQQSATKSAAATAQPVKLPDYAARRREIFGDKVLPNIVLLAREGERW